MLNPGSSKWLSKYFELVESKEISLSIDKPKNIRQLDFVHSKLFHSGVSFGYPISFLFTPQENTVSWTISEKLKVLLLESLIFIYLQKNKSFSPEQFERSLLDFYAQYQESKSASVFKFFVHDSNRSKLEKVLNKRVYVEKSLTNLLWVNYLNNSLVYLDILGYKLFLEKQESTPQTYVNYVHTVMRLIVAASQSDGTIEPTEKTLFDVFLASSNLNTKEKQYYTDLLRNNSEKINVADIIKVREAEPLFHRFLLDVALLLVYSDLHAMEDEVSFLNELCKYLNLSPAHLRQSMVLVESFVLQNNHKISFLRESTSYDRLYESFAKKWVKILGRNRKKLAQELSQNKELILLVNKSLTEELTNEEKDKVKNQFKDIIRTMPALAIFMLPGGALLLPIILKIIPDLVPTAFRSNELRQRKKR
ncbi:MAG: TerB family tellurite resistance protein [Crocinitomicaceae bacterium]|nr:TerB family tellurite resistance protein [Crocinitomicaceae bacterium]